VGVEIPPSPLRAREALLVAGRLASDTRPPWAGWIVMKTSPSLVDGGGEVPVRRLELPRRRRIPLALRGNTMRLSAVSDATE